MISVFFFLNGARMIRTFEENIFYWSEYAFPVISGSSSLDNINIVQREYPKGGVHVRVFCNKKNNWILDVEGTLDFLRHSKMMNITPISIALPLCLSAILLADKIGCACIEIQCSIAGYEEGLQRPQLLPILIEKTQTPLVFWGVNDFSIPLQNSRVSFERQIFL